MERHLALRDFLRAHPDFADRYSELKRRLAEAHPHDMQAYMGGKDGFIQEMQSRALAWPASSGGGPAATIEFPCVMRPLRMKACIVTRSCDTVWS